MRRSTRPGRSSLLSDRRIFLVSLVTAAFLPAAARAQEPAIFPEATPEVTAAPEVSASPTPVPIWNVNGCGAVLAEVRDRASGAPIARAHVLGLPRTSGGEAADSAEATTLRSADLRLIGRTSAEGTLVVPPPGAARLVIEVPGYERTEVETPCEDSVTVLAVDLVALAPEKREDAS
ncbi:MAG TPA: hypothetical protein VMV18_01280, partial [bacterium]|nr:hypothetical protein [bacterium]